MRDLPPVARKYAGLALQRKLQADLLVALTTRAEQAAIEQQVENSGKFQVLDAAQPPQRKSGPSSFANAAIAFLLLGLGQVLLFARRRGLFTLEVLN